ncbi:WG repeat-containing protein [Alistipes sp. ZOR0009]|uniref:WG repeat-containing protein n=1 Tax=Alistipes sp. ZOR0009 TaxID=1339253 RepID=UPI0018CD3205|nr:WG repeat-containing protein [Alistipes sp. ZOR0009]
MGKITLKTFMISCVCFIALSCSNNQNKVNFELIPVKTGEKWGYVNKKGEYKINPQFKDAQFFRDGLAKVLSVDGKVGYITEDGKYKIPAKFKEGTPFKEGFAFVVVDGGYPTCINKSGETIFQLKQAKYAFGFSEGLAMFQTTDDKFGFVDESGKVVVNPQFEFTRPFNEGYAAVCQNKKWGFINKSGKIVINPQFQGVMDFHNGKASFYNGKQSGFIDVKGNYVINPQFDYAMSISEGMASIYSGKLFGFISENGKIIVNPQFEEAFSFKNNLALIKQNDKYGYINKEGKIEINPQFDEATMFFGDVAYVKNADKWGVIDKTGKYLINPQFDEMKSYLSDYNLEMVYNFNLEHLPSVKTDYYNVTSFIKKFFERATNNAFDGFNDFSTLQNIVNHPLYGSSLTDNGEYVAECDEIHEITEEIYINKTIFFFSQPIYTLVSDSWYNTTKQFNLSEELSAIEYQFSFTGNAIDKGGAIANGLKDEIGKRYGINFECKKGDYIGYQKNGKLNFIIVNNDYWVSLYVAFSKENVDKLLLSNASSDSIDNTTAVPL